MLKVESYKKGIVFSTGFNILNKGLVFLNGVLVAYFFGVQPGTDLFFYVYNSVLIIGAFFTSINGTVLIPESMRLRTEEGQPRAMAFLNFFLYLYAAITVAVLLTISMQPVLFFSHVSNFRTEDLSNNRLLLYLSIPLFAMICIINLCVDILISYKFFTIPMIVGIINGLFSISFMLVFHSAWGIKSVLYGLLISYSLNIAMLAALMRRNLRWNFRLVKAVREKRVWKNFGFAQLGNFTSTAASYVPMYILSGFNTGIITALTFAQQISSLPTVLVTYQFSAVAGIKFNELYAEKNFREINRVFGEAANFLHFLLVPISCFIFYFSADIVHILLGYTSLPPSASAYVSLFLKFLGFLLPLLVLNTLIARLFMASHKIGESFWYQILFNVALIAGLYFAVHQIGVKGYPLAMVAAYAFNILASYFIEKHYFHIVNYKAIVANLGWVLIVNAVISTVIFYAVQQMHLDNAILKTAVAFVFYLFVLVGANFIFKLNNEMSRQLLVGFTLLKKKR